MAETTTKLLKARPHFELLDGLRGVAALAVVVYHLMQVAAPHYAVVSIAHGYLAVDFFFCLSGFVIAYAYDNRMKALGILDFCKSRLIRLHPLVIIGSVLGLLSFLYDPCSDIAVQYSAGQKTIVFIASCLMIPYPVVQERNASIFHLNPPAWSLFWEYMATIFYALILVKLRAKVLWILVFCAVILLCYEARHAEYLAVGWNGDSFWGGGIRVLYSFPVGMLIYRSRLISSSRLGSISLSCLLLLAFLLPRLPKINWLIDPFIVVFYFPLLVALGAGVRPAASLKAICRFSGEISYPLYMVHYPFIWLFQSYAEKYNPGLYQLVLIVPLITAFLLALAYLIMTFLDAPIRTHLKAQLSRPQ